MGETIQSHDIPTNEKLPELPPVPQEVTGSIIHLAARQELESPFTPQNEDEVLLAACPIEFAQIIKRQLRNTDKLSTSLIDPGVGQLMPGFNFDEIEQLLEGDYLFQDPIEDLIAENPLMVDILERIKGDSHNSFGRPVDPRYAITLRKHRDNFRAFIAIDIFKGTYRADDPIWVNLVSKIP